MWFRFPAGVTEISCQGQNFGIDAKDANGHAYFRAPDHFAGLILDLPGFASIAEPPEGAPEDLPKADPLRDGAIADMSRQLEALRRDNDDLRASLAEISVERDDMKLKLKELQAPEANPKTPKKET